jgi:hypothetical protein
VGRDYIKKKGIVRVTYPKESEFKLSSTNSRVFSPHQTFFNDSVILKLSAARRDVYGIKSNQPSKKLENWKLICVIIFG